MGQECREIAPCLTYLDPIDLKVLHQRLGNNKGPAFQLGTCNTMGLFLDVQFNAHGLLNCDGQHQLRLNRWR